MGLLPRAREKEAEAAARAVSNIWNPLQAGRSNFACSPAVDLSRTWRYELGVAISGIADQCLDRPFPIDNDSRETAKQPAGMRRSQRLKGLAHQRQQIFQISYAVAMSTEQCRN